MKGTVVFFVFLTFLISCGGNKREADVKTETGKEVYMKYCLACHQAEGSGVPGMYPPLINTKWVGGDKRTLIHLVLNGQQGEIEVNGHVFKGTMPAHQYLSDKQIADLLTFLRSNFGNQADAITPEEVEKVRKSQ
jgi:mono/diheme cytochrome c family protein